MALPRSGPELLERLEARWRWALYRLRFHPFVARDLPRIAATLEEYARLARLDKPIGIWLLLWPTLWAVWIAGRGHPAGPIVVIFTLGTVLMRSAGCAINDYADRRFDPHVARTRERPLAAGRVTPLEALALFALLALAALMLALKLNRLALLYAVAGAFLAVTYPFIKRFLSVPQLYLGLSFGWGIPMAFAAQLERVPRIAWVLFLANILWVTAYDTIYAMVDREDDLKIGVRSTAILFGDADRHVIAILQGLALLTLWLAGQSLRMAGWFHTGLAAAAVFFLYELWLIRRRDRAACFRAFLNNHYVGLVVFLGIAAEYLFRQPPT